MEDAGGGESDRMEVDDGESDEDDEVIQEVEVYLSRKLCEKISLLQVSSTLQCVITSIIYAFITITLIMICSSCLCSC